MKTQGRWFASHVHELDPGECLELLATQEVGRIGFVDEDGPVVLPVNFGLAGGDVLIATTPWASIGRCAPGTVVAFEVDVPDDYTQSGWSVLVRGRAEPVPPSDHVDAEELPWPWAEGERPMLIRVAATSISGRRLVPA